MSVRGLSSCTELWRVIRSGVPVIPKFAIETLLVQPRRLLPTKMSVLKGVAAASTVGLFGLGFTNFCYSSGTIEINVILYVLSY